MQDIDAIIGSAAIDAAGDTIGSISEVYLDDQSVRPEWATVTTGLFGTRETFIPLARADRTGDGVRFPCDMATVKDAPRIDAEGHLSPTEESELFRYHGIGQGTADDRGTQTTADTAGPSTDQREDRHDVTGTVGHDTSGPTTDDAVTRSEERLTIGTEAVETGRARLRKHVVTEDVTRTVPVERGRLATETVTEEHQVTAQVAHEETEQVEGGVRSDVPGDRR